MNKGFRILLVAVIVLLAIAASAVEFALPRGSTGHASAQTTSGNQTITAQGHGAVQVAPDEATLSIGAEKKNAQVAAALDTSSSTLSSIVTVLEGKGIPASHIQTNNLNLYQDGQTGLYDATQTVSVQVDNINSVNGLLKAAVSAGANSGYGIVFNVKDPSAAHSQALQAALKDARSRADTMARALGLTITGVQAVSEGTVAGTVGSPCTQGCGGGGGPIQAGQSTITADVTVTYTAK